MSTKTSQNQNTGLSEPSPVKLRELRELIECMNFQVSMPLSFVTSWEFDDDLKFIVNEYCKFNANMVQRRLKLIKEFKKELGKLKGIK